ncbi:hypothetical protein EVAR_30605_1 [Eumeta japonica]|uniref:Uncharacterized protein n=1 Tax=Eumeta variegata TaxID=151549 RepID=A0A4C1WBI9_EUMVA|nr:hypothetical protein EVAR_30605_1 [Eumeta japonica]
MLNRARREGSRFLNHEKLGRVLGTAVGPSGLRGEDRASPRRPQSTMTLVRTLVNQDGTVYVKGYMGPQMGLHLQRDQVKLLAPLQIEFLSPEVVLVHKNQTL